MSKYWIYLVAGWWGSHLESNSSAANSSSHLSFSFILCVHSKKKIVLCERKIMKEVAKYLCSFAVSKSFNSFVCQNLAFQTTLYAKLSQAVLHCSIFLTYLIIFIIVTFLQFEYMLKQKFQISFLLTFFPFCCSVIHTYSWSLCFSSCTSVALQRRSRK